MRHHKTRTEFTFTGWLHILKFKHEHFQISDGTYSERCDPEILRITNNVFTFTLENKNGDVLYTNNKEYEHFAKNYWVLEGYDNLITN